MEQYINGFDVTLTSAITDTVGTSISVSQAASIDGNFRLLIDSELLLVVSGGTTTTWTVTRGVESTTASTHLSGTTIYIILTAGALSNILSGITGLTPNANFILTQNSVAALTSEESGAIANTLYLKQGNVGIGTTSPSQSLSVGFIDSSQLVVVGAMSPDLSGVYSIAGTANGENYYQSSKGYIWWYGGYWFATTYAPLSTYANSNDFYSASSASVPPTGVYSYQYGASGSYVLSMGTNSSPFTIDNAGNGTILSSLIIGNSSGGVLNVGTANQFNVDPFGGVIINGNSPGGTGTLYAGGIPGYLDFGGLWIGTSATAPDTTNYSFLGNGGDTFFNTPADGKIDFNSGNVAIMSMYLFGGTGGSLELQGSTYNLIKSTSAGDLFFDNDNNYIFRGPSATETLRLTSTGNVGIGTTGPTSQLHLAAGSATAGTAPLGFTSGPLLTVPVEGKVEYSSGVYYATDAVPTRNIIAMTPVANPGLGTVATPLVIVTAQLTTSGTQGSMTFINGILVASTPAT